MESVGKSLISFGSIVKLHPKGENHLAIITDGFVDKNVYLKMPKSVPFKSEYRGLFMIIPKTTNKKKVSFKKG